MRKLNILLALLPFSQGILLGQSMSREEIVSAAQQQLPEAIAEFREFLQIPNNGRYQKHMEWNVDWCKKALTKRGFEVQVLSRNGVPHVLAERVFDPQYKTVLFYMQIDGQPVDTAAWYQPNPYIPVLKEFDNGDWNIIDWPSDGNGLEKDHRIFARSASDSKGPSQAFISAMDILNERGIEPKFNLKLILDFQEEISSPQLAPLVEENRDLFAAHTMLIMDGTRHLSNLPTLTFGARGIATITLKVFGSTRNLHSGQYGNFAPNPVFKLAELIADMKDEQGRVTIPGYYDGVELTDEEKNLINQVPEDLNEITQSLGIAEPDGVGGTYQEALQYPSLNVRGINAAWVGSKVRTIIPSEAVAEIDMRLVLETDGQRQVQLVRDYIASKGYHFVDSIPTVEERRQYSKLISFTSRVGSKPFKTDMTSDLGDWLSNAMRRVYGNQFVKMQTTGGSQPIAPFISVLGVPAVSIRIPNPDNSIHAPNENIRVGNFLQGIEMCLAILTQPLN